jgi:thiol-disulfide isomerase/thioredoxin
MKPWLPAVLLLLCLTSFAQKEGKRLYVGDKVPDITFNGMYNYSSSTAKLSDFKGKAVILDFWNKNCSSCIASFPKMQQIQERFKEDLVILLVNNRPKETKDALKLLFAKSPILKNTELPLVLGDSQYNNGGTLFSHLGVPFHIWIDKNGIVKATVSNSSTTMENVKDFIDGKTLNLPNMTQLSEGEVYLHKRKPQSLLNYGDGILSKYLVYYNKLRPFNLKADEQTENLSKIMVINPSFPYYSLFMKDPSFDLGNMVTAGTGNLYDVSGVEIGIRTQSSMMELYDRAYQLDGNIKIVIKEEDADRYYPPLNGNVDDVNFWIKNNRFVYEIAWPDYNPYTDREKVNQALKLDLENYFGLRGGIELRTVNAIVLHRNDQPLKLDSKGGEPIYEDTKSEKGTIIQNWTIQSINVHLTGFLLNEEKDNPVFIDETGIDPNKKIDIVIHGSLKDIPALNKEFSKYGLGIKAEERILPVLVLRKVK